MTKTEILNIIDSMPALTGINRSNPDVVEHIKNYTLFLPDKVPLQQRIWHLRNGDIIPKCQHCNNEVKWHHVKQQYNLNCSVKCANNDISKIKNIQDTVIKTFGSQSYAQRNIDPDILTNIQSKEWILDQHINQEKSLNQIALENNLHVSTISNYLKKHDIKAKLFAKSLPEKLLVEFMSDLGIVNIETNVTNIITPYELDIYLPDYNLAIEFCGLYWHCSKHTRITRSYHKNKLDKCNNKGIRLITIFEDEWIHSSELVKQKIASILGKDTRPRLFARKCKIIDVDNKTKSQFFNQYHIQGDGPGSINIGLEYNNELVACMAFIKQPNNVMNLNRYATSKQVVGGFSKLLSYFKKNQEWNQIISFADLRWSTGNMYEVNGFHLEKTLPVDYYYVNFTNMTRIHKFNFRHKNLPNILGEGYDHKLSETQNTHNNGWYRIYNCGLLRYIMDR